MLRDVLLRRNPNLLYALSRVRRKELYRVRLDKIPLAGHMRTQIFRTISSLEQHLVSWVECIFHHAEVLTCTHPRRQYCLFKRIRQKQATLEAAVSIKMAL